MATIKFLGAAQQVTGSCHLVESPSIGKVILDCGMHQGGSSTERLSRDNFAFEAASIDAVILSHAHLDHCGLLPKLVHQGFSGPIFCSTATAELLDIMLHDSVGLYERDLEHKNRRLARSGHKLLKPEYVKADVRKVLKQCRSHPYKQVFTVGPSAQVIFHDAGHILGSSIVEITLMEKNQPKTLVFTGDLGNRNAVLMNDPTRLNSADVVIMEGTYGDRDHRAIDDTYEEFKTILRETWRRGGNIMIPAFAVGRTQELLFYLGRLHKEGELDNWQVFLDSPMAIAVTKIYDRWLETLDCQDIKALCSGDQTLLKDFIPHLQLAITPEESMAINKIKSGAIIIAGSGMCTGGRIRHHFKQRIWDKRNTVIFVGFQARGTLGRIIVDGVKHIKMFGDDFIVKAGIETLGGFSAHAGQSELIEWISHFTTEPRIMLVHGEAEALDCLAQTLWESKGINAEVALPQQSIAF